MRLIHITDPHLSSLASLGFMELRGKRRSGYLSWRRRRRYVHRPEVLDELTGRVHAESPDQILLTGDLLHIGLEREAAEAAAWLRGLGPPERIMLIPGNHDIYADDSMRMLEAHWGGYLPARYPAVRDLEGLRLIALNSSVVTPIFSAAGALGPEQRERLPQALAPDRLNVLLIHHPPLPGMTARRKALRDADRLESQFGRHAPDLVLYGHIHVNRMDRYRSTRMYCTASASSRKNASYRVFDVERQGRNWRIRMRLESRADQGTGDFRTVDEQEWEVRR